MSGNDVLLQLSACYTTPIIAPPDKCQHDRLLAPLVFFVAVHHVTGTSSGASSDQGPFLAANQRAAHRPDGGANGNMCNLARTSTMPALGEAAPPPILSHVSPIVPAILRLYCG
jgi:hypothetical protein